MSEFFASDCTDVCLLQSFQEKIHVQEYWNVFVSNLQDEQTR